MILDTWLTEKVVLLKGLDDLITDQQNEIETKFRELNAALAGHNEPQVNQNDPLLAITTRARTTTKDPPYPGQQSNAIEPNISHEEDDNVNSQIPEQSPQVTPSPPTPLK